MLDSIVAEDGASCLAKLQALCGEDVEAAARGAPAFATDAGHQAAPPCGDAFDIEAGIVPSAPAGGKGAGGAEKMNRVKPLHSFQISSVGPLPSWEFTVWGYYHLALLNCIPLAMGLFVQVLIADGFSDILHLMLAVTGVSLASALAAAGRLLEVLRHLRRQVVELTVENVRAEAINREMAKRIAHLESLQTGFEKLQTLCEGNVDKARELIRKSNRKIKVAAMALVTTIFGKADSDKDFKVSGADRERFFESLGFVFRSVPGFDAAEIKRATGSIVAKGDIKAIVDMITAFRDVEASKETWRTDTE